VPQPETRLSYRVRIGERTVAQTSDEYWHYPRSSQIEDGVMGPTIIAVAQVSDQFGAGPEAEVSIDV
jgi:hypothetical protein